MSASVTFSNGIIPGPGLHEKLEISSVKTLNGVRGLMMCENGGALPPGNNGLGDEATNFPNLDKNNNGRENQQRIITSTAISRLDNDNETSSSSSSSSLQHHQLGNGEAQNQCSNGSRAGCESEAEDFISGQTNDGPSRCEIVNQETFLVDVIVRNAVSPLNFSIQNYRESLLLQNLEDEMTNWYNAYEAKGAHAPLLFKDLKLDGFYALKYRNLEEKSERWVRCQIKKPFGETLPILTHLVDHGCYYSTEPKCIRPLRRKYCRMPCQSFDAKLHFEESSKASYTPEDCHRFHNQVEGKSFCAIVLKNPITNLDNKLVVILIDTSTEKDHYIHHDYSNPSSKSANGRK